MRAPVDEGRIRPGGEKGEVDDPTDPLPYSDVDERSVQRQPLGIRPVHRDHEDPVARLECRGQGVRIVVARDRDLPTRQGRPAPGPARHHPERHAARCELAGDEAPDGARRTGDHDHAAALLEHSLRDGEGRVRSRDAAVDAVWRITSLISSGVRPLRSAARTCIASSC